MSNESGCAGALLKEFPLEIRGDVIESSVARALEHKVATMKLPGFRPGKVPFSMVEQRYGEEVTFSVLEDLVGKRSEILMAEHGLKPAFRPHFHADKPYKKGEDFSCTIHVEVLPNIPDVDLKNLDITRCVIAPDPKKLEELVRIRARAAGANISVQPPRVAAYGDILKIDFEGVLGGRPLKGGQAKGYELELGSNQFIPGFEQGLIGKEKDATVDLNLTFPEHYHDRHLSGKEVSFTVKILDVMERVPATIDADLAKKHGFDSMQAMEEVHMSILRETYSRLEYDYVKQNALDALDGLYDFPVPERMVLLELETVLRQVSRDSGVTSPDAETLEKWKKDYRKIAERRVRLGLVLADLSEKQNIKINKSDIESFLRREAKKYPGQEQRIADYYRENPNMSNQMKAEILEEKAIDFVLKTARIEERVVSEEGLLRLLDGEA